jgi:hypothetical protein
MARIPTERQRVKSPDSRGFWRRLPAIAGLLAVAGLVAIPIMLTAQLHTTRLDRGDRDLVCTSVLGVNKPPLDGSYSGASPENAGRNDTPACNQARIEQLAWTAVVMVPTVALLAVALASLVAGARSEDAA